MLSVNQYPKTYVDECRARMDAQLASYEALAATAKRAAVDAFEPQFLTHLVLALDESFLHRARGGEGKDGNPLNEVRMLCDAILNQGNVLTADKTIKYKADQSVLGLDLGDEVCLDLAGFRRLATAFFDEIEHKFG